MPPSEPQPPVKDKVPQRPIADIDPARSYGVDRESPKGLVRRAALEAGVGEPDFEWQGNEELGRPAVIRWHHSGGIVASHLWLPHRQGIHGDVVEDFPS